MPMVTPTSIAFVIVFFIFFHTKIKNKWQLDYRHLFKSIFFLRFYPNYWHRAKIYKFTHKKGCRNEFYSLYGSPNWARTSDIMINSHALYRLSYGGISVYCILLSVLIYANSGIKYTNVGVFLFSQAVTSQVSSALLSLTSVFGMGTGVPSASSTPTLLCRFPYIYIYHTLVRK